MTRASRCYSAWLLVALCVTACSSVGHPPPQPTVIEYRLARWLAGAGEPGVGLQVDGDPRSVGDSAVAFDGDGDRLVLRQNPLAGAGEFTVEVVLRPADVYPANVEPRFLHIESPSDPRRRVTMELRLDDHHQWYLDAFIKSDTGSLALIDPGKVHPVGGWHHAAITYRGGTFSTFVDGVKELEGRVDYLPIPDDANTSIGARLNRVHWFAGEIASVRVTHAALQPAEFTGVPPPMP